MSPEWPIDAKLAAHNQTERAANITALVHDVVKEITDPIGASLTEMEKSFARILESHRRLEAVLDRLLAAAKRTNLYFSPDNLYGPFLELQAAIAAAEERET
jgi:hypothetical protein